MVEAQWNELEVASKEVVMHAAEQFARVFVETPQYQAFEKSFTTYRQDAAAQSALQAFQKKQAALKGLLMLNAVSEEDRQELQSLQDRFYQQAAVVQYSQAQADLIAMSQEIGDILSKSIGLDFGSACRTTTGGCCG
jgi:cell fate (sporulation/competence/biofilm development) regulator YlbF (YheA/YmcA/DUF963 family)